MSSFASNPTLYYWNCKARNYHILVVAKAGGINVTQKNEPEDFDMAALKPTLPFGQLPYLVDGDIKIAQSNAIFRYLARKGNQQGENEHAFADSEMLTEESVDITNLLNRAYYGPNKNAGLDALFAAGSNLHTQLAYLERKHPGDGPFFNSAGKRVAGAYAIACTLDILLDLHPTLLDGYPKMKAFHAAMVALPAFEGLKTLPPYYTRD